MEQSLSMSLRQKLAMTAQMQQAIRILQLSAHDLQALVETEYLENPALEMEDPAQSREAEPEDGRLSLEQVSELARFLGDEERGPHDFHENTGRSFEAGSAVRPSLETELREQAAFVFPPGRQRRIAFFLIGSVDDCGYLQCTLADAARQLRVPEAEAEEVLTVLQGFEPAGVCARSLQECLVIQARQQGIYQGLTAAVLDHHLDLVAAARIPEIAELEKCTPAEVQLAVDMIRRLNPKPGASYGGGSTDYILPDAAVRKVNGEYQVVLNDGAMPQLHISSVYKDPQSLDAEARSYLEQRMNAALWLLKSIEQRRQTLLKVITEIVHRQREAIEKGPASLHPLLMKDVAETVGVHESTVSRAVAHKYLETPWGVFSLKKFFSARLTARPNGEDLAALQVKEAMKGLIEAEDAAKPLSDQQLTDLLGAKGMKLSRRTVMKYREQLGYPSSTKRKRY